MGDGWIEIATTHAADETKAHAASLALAVSPGSVIALDGDLGAGKTQFTQGLASGLGVPGPVTSPTFNLMEVYEGGSLPLYHFDLYRLDDPADLEDIAFYDYVEGDGVSCVEWASKFADEMPDDRLEVYIEVVGETTRRIRARGLGAAVRVLDAWRAALA